MFIIRAGNGQITPLGAEGRAGLGGRICERLYKQASFLLCHIGGAVANVLQRL